MAEQITCKITKAVGRSCNNRQGGIDKLYLFAYVKYSKSLNLVQDQKVVTFPLTDAFLYEAENISFSESTSVKNGGIEWSQDLNFTITESNDLSEVYKLANQDYSAVILDRNGNYRFIGMRNGGEVTVKSTSGVSKSDMNGYTISLKAKEDNQAYYVPDFETLFNVITPTEFETPSNPENLSYSNFNGGATIDLTWDVSVRGTLPIAGYYVFVNGFPDYTLTTNSLNITDLQEGTEYSIYVKAFDTEGNVSGADGDIDIITVRGDYPFRVATDGGTTESIECVEDKL